MKRELVAGLFAAAICAGAAAGPYEANWASLDRRPVPQWWVDAKFGIFIHWGVYSVPAYAPVSYGNDEAKYLSECYSEHYQHRILQGRTAFVEHNKRFNGGRPYAAYAPEFKAEHFDAAKWADLFKRAGARYAVLTSKHHDGFALWPSKATPYYNAVETGPHRDICGEFMEAMHKAGLKAGFYYSLLEYGNPAYTNKENLASFVENMNLVQLKELADTYRADIIWPDGEWGETYKQLRSEEYLAWLFNESKVRDTVVVNDRWGKDPATGKSVRGRHGGHYTTEYGFDTGEIGDGTKGKATAIHPWEECRGIGLSFGYNRFERAWHYMSTEACIHLLVRVAAGGGNLLLNIGPDRHGLIPPIMEERLLGIGKWLSVNGEAIYGTRAWPGSPGDRKMNADHLFFTAKGDDIYAIATAWPAKTMTVKGATGVKAVTLLGSDAKVAWRETEGGLEIEPPALNPGNDPSRFAWAFRIAR